MLQPDDCSCINHTNLVSPPEEHGSGVPEWGRANAAIDMNIPELLADERSLGVFLLVTVAMGGGAAWLAGRAIASAWRPWWHVALYMLVLGLAVRFIHFALFQS